MTRILEIDDLHVGLMLSIYDLKNASDDHDLEEMRGGPMGMVMQMVSSRDPLEKMKGVSLVVQAIDLPYMIVVPANCTCKPRVTATIDTRRVRMMKISQEFANAQMNVHECEDSTKKATFPGFWGRLKFLFMPARVMRENEEGDDE